MSQLLLRAERRLRGNRQGRNALESAGLVALQAERDKQLNPLEVLEQFQAVVEVAAAAEPDAVEGVDEISSVDQRRLWRVLAERRRDQLKTGLLNRDDLLSLIAKRFEQAEQLRAAGNETAGRQVYQRFVSLFMSEQRLEPWRECAQQRAAGGVAEQPAF